MVKISFICPVYNKIKYLPHVIKSLKGQIGNFDKEYIFINDGSTDDSLNYIKKTTTHWKNKLIINQKNCGPAKATQAGIRKSSGDYIKLVGGDDVMSKNCTNILLEAIRKTNSVAVFSKYKLIKNYDKIGFKDEKPKISKVINDPLEQTIISCYSGTTPNLYLRSAVLKSKGCDEKLFVEDFSLVLRLARFGSFCFINNVTCCGPKDDKNRIMIGQKKQLLHDYNAALYYFIKENPDIKLNYKRAACKKALGRAEKWYRRTQKKTIFSLINLIRISFYFLKNRELNFLKKSCNIFYLDNEENSKDIRYRID